MHFNREQIAGVNKLVKRNFKIQKWKNALLFFIIILIICFSSSFSILKYNEYKNLERYAQHINGTSGDAVFYGLTEQEAEKIKTSPLCRWTGESMLVAETVSSKMGNQYTEMRYADNNYAEAFYSKPTVGTMPVKYDEIAAGIRTLKKLGIPIRLNEIVKLSWKKDKQNQSMKFKLVGYWEEDIEVNHDYIWVSKELGQAYSLKKDAVVSFKSNHNLEKEAGRLASDIGVGKKKYTVMHLNKYSILAGILLDLKSWTILSVVFLIGTLILNSIQQISVAGNLAFYGRIKAMGAEERQIRNIIWFEVLFITAIAAPFGLLAGYFAGIQLTPLFVNGGLGYTLIYYDSKILISSFFYILPIVVAANIKPAILAGKTDIEKAFKYKGDGDDSGNIEKKYPGIPVILQMSMDNIARYKKRTAAGICILVVGLVWISSFYVIHIGFDQEKYLSARSVSHFMINAEDLSKETVGKEELENYAKQIQNMDGITGLGLLYLQREYRKIPHSVYRNIRNYYEANENERLEYMEYDVLWMEQYKELQDSYSCKHQIWGISGLLIDEIMHPQNLISGRLDAEAFQTGKYVIAQGISGDQGMGEIEPTYSVGDMVTIANKNFEVMAVVEIPNAVNQGINSALSGFELSFYIPVKQFQQLYPGKYPQKLFINTSSYIKEKIEQMFEQLEIDKNFSFISEQRLIEQYKKDIISQNGIEILIGYALLGIGLIQLINATASSVINRRKEFVLMHCMGMTQKQIRFMLIFESLICIFLVLIFAYILSLCCINTLVKIYIDAYWASTFNFSIAPLLILTPFLILFAILIPIIAYKFEYLDVTQDRL